MEYSGEASIRTGDSYFGPEQDNSDLNIIYINRLTEWPGFCYGFARIWDIGNSVLRDFLVHRAVLDHALYSDHSPEVRLAHLLHGKETGRRGNGVGIDPPLRNIFFGRNDLISPKP